MRFSATLIIALLLLGCSKEDEPTKQCLGIWEVELLHSGATAEVVDGTTPARYQSNDRP